LEELVTPLEHQWDSGNNNYEAEVWLPAVLKCLGHRKSEQCLATASRYLHCAASMSKPQQQAFLLPSVQLDALGHQAPASGNGPICMFLSFSTLRLLHITPNTRFTVLPFCHSLASLELQQEKALIFCEG
jgi:hypothetical protein